MKQVITINGIPVPSIRSCEKVDLEAVREGLSKDPHYKLTCLGFTAKEAFIMELSTKWEAIKDALEKGATKEQISNI